MPDRRSTQKKMDERAFPIRLRFEIPPRGLGARLSDAHVWLREHAGRHQHAVHTDNGCLAVYVRTPALAVAFVEAFADFDLADGTVASWYTAPGR